MSRARVLLLTTIAMLAFAGNSLLCRLALKHTAIDPASFTTFRLVYGELLLWVLTLSRGGASRSSASWVSAGALFGYAIAFSLAYVSLSAATGALLLFGAVQATMIGYGRWRGERFSARQLIGFVAALAGLLSLLLPGATAPPLIGALLMLVAGIAWGVYSLRGKGQGDPTATTAGNFMRAAPLALIASAIALPWLSLAGTGAAYAVASGAIASAVGYAIWYAALPGLTATSAATVQLSVPVIAAFGGVLLLDEPFTARLVLAAIAILGGIAMVVLDRARP
jgi:drug/metabolite transporter (DMT)-like permease